MKALVTGAAGFIGSHVADHCLDLGLEVVAVDDLSGGFRVNVPKGATWVRGDLRDSAFVSRLWLEYGPFDYVYHLAAYAAEGLSHFIRTYNYSTNVLASANLINEAINSQVCKCFVFTSSIAVYGHGRLPMCEEFTPKPADPYGISKYAVELDLKAAHDMFGLDYVVFRPHNVYGERQNIADKYRNVIGVFMNQLMWDQPMTIFGDGKQTRAFSHVDDVAPVIVRGSMTPRAYNKTFNVGADLAYTVRHLADEVAAAMGKPADVRYLPTRNEVVHAWADHRKVQDVLGVQPKIDLKTGLARMAKWVKSRGLCLPTPAPEIEITHGLPQCWW